jgi:hypothetical protein
MNGPDHKELTLDRLADLLDAYGGDLSRWPERLAGQARLLIGTSSAARRMHDEARALDLVLAKASAPDPARLSLLADRIVTIAGREGAPVAADADRETGKGARIIAMPAARRAGAAGKGDRLDRGGAAVPKPALMARWLGGGSWPAAAALAASLAFGFFIGLNDYAPTAAYNVASLVEPGTADVDIALSALQFDPLNGLDEEQI